MVKEFDAAINLNDDTVSDNTSIDNSCGQDIADQNDVASHENGNESSITPLGNVDRALSVKRLRDIGDIERVERLELLHKDSSYKNKRKWKKMLRNMKVHWFFLCPVNNDAEQVSDLVAQSYRTTL